MVVCSCHEGHWRDLTCKVWADGCGQAQGCCSAKSNLPAMTALLEASGIGIHHSLRVVCTGSTFAMTSQQGHLLMSITVPTARHMGPDISSNSRGAHASHMPATTLITCYCTKAGGLPGSYLGSSKSALQLGHVQMTRFPMIRPT